MFQGETALSIDDKGRMAIPSQFREPLQALGDARLVVTYNPFEGDSLWLFPVHEWEQVRDQVMSLSSFERAHRELQRKLVGAAAHLEPDAQSRLLLPQSARQAARIEKRAVLLGMGSKFELWSEQAHLALIGQSINDNEISEEMRSLKF